MRRRRLGLLLAAAGLAGCTPRIYRAAYEGRTEEVMRLAKAPGALETCERDVRRCGYSFATPLTCAASAGRADTVQALLAKGAPLEPRCGASPLYAAASNGRIEVVRLLLNAGADPDGSGDTVDARDARDPKGRSVIYRPLISAVEHPEIVRILLAAGADPTKRWGNGETCAQAAAKWFNQFGSTRWIADPAGAHESVVLLEKAADPAERARLAAEKTFEGNRAKVEAVVRQGDAAAEAGRAQEAFSRYLEAYRAYPVSRDGRAVVLAKLLDVARLMEPPPAIPDEAQEHASRAQAFVKLAEDASGFRKAAVEYEKALETAPWWAEAYYNQGLALEKAGDKSGSVKSLRRFLVAAPQSPEVDAVKQRIIELEVADELKHAEP